MLGNSETTISRPMLVLDPVLKKLTKPAIHEWNKKTLLVTFATQRYIDSLIRWLSTVTPRLSTTLQARVYLGNDVDTMTQNLLKSINSSIEFYTIPVFEVQGFPDICEPQHFAWKLWIYQELVQQQELHNTLIWYMDVASMIVRMPTEWLAKAAETGLCMLEDPQQKNDQWCQPSFCKRLQVTPDELSQQQVVGGIMAFIGGAILPWKVFMEAWVLAQQRDILVGPKWSGQLPDGRPYGHRHDQSILSLLRLRRTVPTYPLYNVYCDESLRRTFKSGAALYIHRDNFKENVNFAPRIGEVHLINLERRKDRLQRFKENHSWSKNVCLCPAYDGLKLTLTPALARLFATNDFKWKKSIAGCALSHLSLWVELAAESPSCENYLILEDDVKFQPNWIQIWQNAAKEIPEDYDVLYLGGVLPPNKGMFANVLEAVTPNWSKVKPNQLFGQKEPSSYFHFCNYSYILSRKGAQKILDAINENGIYTSGDHMICNRMDMNHYILTPIVAGCYQDDDPKYQTSEFNNFNRVDKFDSDLWNNDERFSEEDITTNSNSFPINIQEALHDAKLTAPATTPYTALKLYTIGDCRLVKGSLLEYDWLNTILEGRLDTCQQVSVDHDFLDSPIFAVMKPHFSYYLDVFKRYEAAKKPYYALHISDEHGNDPIDWYASCKHVLRIYPREMPYKNVTIIPLGPYRIPPKQVVHQKTQIWSFYGTRWANREEAMKPLLQLQPNSYILYDTWMDKKQLSSTDYSEQCLKSIFMPCPHGNNVETFRLWEALEHGCIPLYIVKSKDLFAEYVSKHLPLVVLDSWDSAANFVMTLLEKPEMLNDYRTKLLTAWAVWKKELTTVCEMNRLNAV
jgi:GR25 family glycosyltransferase involved in LPS biosynthesis